MAARAKLDGNERLDKFAKILEEVIVGEVEKGNMTKDLAICVHNTTNVARDTYMSTEEFMNAIAASLKAKADTFLQ